MDDTTEASSSLALEKKTAFCSPKLSQNDDGSEAASVDVYPGPGGGRLWSHNEEPDEREPVEPEEEMREMILSNCPLDLRLSSNKRLETSF
ncbi:unnamed protein product [Protopolystoma xenopodis]|uniref:Uncharacterized protein n=1 Tax=Protopolystoma xenopodis TaxID=117903 RepID=A0A448WRS5_9PLAT|nr:unnamed protein product [Protopolystoma xenopodis]